MAKYLKEYRLADMRVMIRNNKTPHHRSSASLAGKTAVITGATSGVGLAAARELRRFGCDLILVARNEMKVKGVIEELSAMPSDAFGAGAQNGSAANPGAGTTPERRGNLGATPDSGGPPKPRGNLGATPDSGRNPTVRYYLADFSDLKQVQAASEEILRTEPQIDILINSAGMHSTKLHRTAEGFELVFCVNHLAPFLLTHRLLPLLRESPEARIIQVNSQGHRFNGLDVEDLNWRRRRYTGMRGYGASKTAQLLTVWEFADRLRGTSVAVNAMHPGEVKSSIGSNNGRFYNWYKRHVLGHLLKDTRISGESLHYLAADPALAGVSGMYFNLTHPEKPAPHALDREIGRVVWEKTLKMTGLSDEL